MLECQGFQGRNNDASHSTVLLEKQLPCSLLEPAGKFRCAHTRGCSTDTQGEPGRVGQRAGTEQLAGP